ncbi:hypothetical protein HJG60_010041 [Phyllostomus discolor]|uniref:Uncharacterized protein n=1 Tax=Phyllostomus discolor TaxID=89673 RepID=A0A834B1U7_9CHIR|nr:hypothetical protein HJG60_010041 [Phyllostomus discolor]
MEALKSHVSCSCSGSFPPDWNKPRSRKSNTLSKATPSRRFPRAGLISRVNPVRVRPDFLVWETQLSQADLAGDTSLCICELLFSQGTSPSQATQMAGPCAKWPLTAQGATEPGIGFSLELGVFF